MFILKNEFVCVAGEGGGVVGRLYDHFLSFVFMGERIQQLNMSYPQNSICNFPMTHQYSKCTLISQASFCVFWSGHKLTNILRYCHAKIERKCMQSGVSCLCIQHWCNRKIDLESSLCMRSRSDTRRNQYRSQKNSSNDTSYKQKTKLLKNMSTKKTRLTGTHIYKVHVSIH